MKFLFKIFKILLVLIILIIGLIASLVFTKSGNNILRPYAQKFINSQISPHTMEFQEFQLQGKDTHIIVKVDNQYKADISGTYSILKQDINLKYTLQDTIETNMLNIAGTAKGDTGTFVFMDIDVTGEGQALYSDTKYSATIKSKNVLENLALNIKNLNTKYILKLTKQPLYASSDITIDIISKKLNINKPKLRVVNSIKKLTLNESLIQKDFNITLPTNMNITGVTTHNIDNTNITSNINIHSNVIQIISNESNLNTKNLKANGDFKITVPDLARLERLSGKKLRGHINIDGDYAFDQTLRINGTSDIAESNTSFTLVDNTLDIVSKDISTDKLLFMLRYPELFTSTGELTLNYNIFNGNGKYSFNLNNGHITQSKITKKLKSMTSIDVSQIIYHKGEIEGNISKEVITLDGYMGGDKDKITLNNTKIYPDTKQIESRLWFKHKNEELKLKLSGDISNPKIRIDFKEILKGRLGSKVNEKVASEAGRFLKKSLDKLDVNDDVKNLVKDNLKNIDADKVKGILNGLF